MDFTLFLVLSTILVSVLSCSFVTLLVISYSFTVFLIVFASYFVYYLQVPYMLLIVLLYFVVTCKTVKSSIKD